ncbi:MAG: response regulator transcription factor [Chloroflexi bacterium]|nr:response regulator transcription factor [Chloroflexota bacterium]
MSKIRLLIVDDHIVVRRGLRSMLADAEDIEIVGESSNADQALKQATELQPDVMLLDIRLPGMDGLRLLRILTDKLPNVKVIILTIYDEEQFLVEAFRSGAFGYLLKNISRETLLDALRKAHSGKRMLSEELLDNVLEHYSHFGKMQLLEHYNLTDSEIALLRIVSEGASNREIAEKLYWSETTVKRKLSEVFEKLNVNDRAQAVAFAMRHGLI